MIRADEIRQAISNQTIQWKDQVIDLTISIGLAVYPLHGEREDELLSRAEKELALSRQSGIVKQGFEWTEEELNEET